MKSFFFVRYGLLVFSFVFLLKGVMAAEQVPLTVLASPMDGSPGVVFEEGKAGSVVAEGPGSQKVTRFDDDFTGRIDLKTLGVDPLKFDLLKVEVKADRGASLRFSLENFPQTGQLSHWYVLDTARGPFDWRTIWIDLNKPEEIKAAGAYKGMGAGDPEAHGLRFNGGVKDLKRAIQPPGRTMLLGKIRFCRKAVDLNWDQAQFSYTGEKGKDLVYTYPLTVTNKLDKPITVGLKAVPYVHQGATQTSSAAFSVEKVPLAVGEKKEVSVKITLPAAVVEKSPPLYAERFEIRAAASEVPDSEVTILSSADPIHVAVVVPVPEDKLSFPLLPHKGISLAKFDEAKARADADATGPDDLNGLMENGKKGFNFWKGKKTQAEPDLAFRCLSGLTACAFLYDQTGDKKYLEKGTAILLRFSELWPKYAKEWKDTPYTMISDGILCMNVLGMGWVLGGSRSAYNYDRHGVYNDFDLLAAGMDEATRKKILQDFIIPSAVHMRGHYFGLTNQQDVTNYPILYAGLAARNWPLAIYGYNSEHGILGQLQWGFSDDGLAGEVNYHTPALEPITWSTELLLKIGINLYDARFYECLYSRAAKALGKPFDRPILAFFDQERFTPEAKQGTAKADSNEVAKTDGVHLAGGITKLQWNGLEVCMNWAEQMNRSAPDRCALQITKPGSGKEKEVIGGGNYTHQSLGQSIIIIDEHRQNTEPAEVTGVDITGPVQYVQATSDKHYPSTIITRTFALVDKHVLVVDRVTSKDGQPHIVDWCLRYHTGKGLYTNIAKGVDVALKTIPGSFTAKPADKAHGVDFGAKLFTAKNEDGSAGAMEHMAGETEGSWRQSKGDMLMMGEKGTQVLVFAVSPAFSSVKAEPNGVPVMMARRKDVKETDFLTTFSPDVKTIERVPVKTSDGKDAKAIGVKITLNDGKTFQSIVNYEPKDVEVSLGDLKTKERFASDYQ